MTTQWKKRKKKDLTSLQYEIAINAGTEVPFDNAYWDLFEPGIYVDILSGQPLFSSRDKLVCSHGWPSFAQPINKEEIIEKLDKSLYFERIEVRAKTSNIHLGHVFKDGPKELGGLRYCINSAVLLFIPQAKMVEEGYAAFLKMI